MGSSLSQPGTPPGEFPIGFFSHNFIAAELNYSTIEKEFLAIVASLKHFRPYLFMSVHPVKIYTDHRPLKYVMSIRDTSSRLMRWCLKLEDYNYQIIFRPGKLNVVADALSRPRLDVDYLSIDSIDARNSATILVVTRSKTKQSAETTTPIIEPITLELNRDSSIDPCATSFDEYNESIKNLVIINPNINIITTNLLIKKESVLVTFVTKQVPMADDEDHHDRSL